jgi:prepilin-type N-terminal cleavage/methylation domain-containing protein
MTLVEMLVTLAIASILSTALGSLVFYSSRSFAALINYAEFDQQSRAALDLISKEVRQANRLVEFTQTELTFEDSAGTHFAYVYDPDKLTLTRYRNGIPDSKPLLKNCKHLQFSIFQRNPKTGVYDQYPTGTPETAKLIQLHWICSKNLHNSLINSESVQSAKIVIRKQ